MPRILPLLLLCAAANAAEVDVPTAPPSVFADTESVTNAALPARAMASARLVRCTVELAASASNCVEVAFGRDADGDGALVEDEAAVRLGWDAGEWFLEGGTNRVEAMAADPPSLARLTDAAAVEIAERNLLGLSRQPEIPATVERTGDHVRVYLPLFLFPHRSNRSFPDDWVSVWIDAKTGEAIRSPAAISQAEVVEIAKLGTADLFYDRNAAPAVEFGSSVCKVTFWFPPHPELPGQAFAAATVWVDAEKKSVIQVEVAED